MNTSFPPFVLTPRAGLSPEKALHSALLMQGHAESLGLPSTPQTWWWSMLHQNRDPATLLERFDKALRERYALAEPAQPAAAGNPSKASAASARKKAAGSKQSSGSTDERNANAAVRDRVSKTLSPSSGTLVPAAQKPVQEALDPLAHLEESLRLWADSGFGEAHGDKDLLELGVTGRVASYLQSRCHGTADVFSAPKLVSNLARMLEKDQFNRSDVLTFSRQIRDAIGSLKRPPPKPASSPVKTPPQVSSMDASVNAFAQALADHRSKLDRALRMDRNPMVTVEQLQKSGLNGLSIAQFAGDENLRNALKAIFRQAYADVSSHSMDSPILGRHPDLKESMAASDGDHVFNFVHVTDAHLRNLKQRMEESGVPPEALRDYLARLNVFYRKYGLMS